MSVKTVLFLGFVTAVSSISAIGAEKKLIPVESFTQQDQFSSPRLSPDGKHIAIKVRMMRNGRMIPTLSVYSLPELQLVSTMALPKFEIPLDYVWATNTRLIITKGLEVGLREAPMATGELVAVDLDGKRFQYLYGYANYKSSTKGERYGDDYGYGSIESIPTVRNEHVLVGSYLWGADRSFLYDIDSVKASRTLLAEIGVIGMSFHVQNNGMPRFANGTNEDNIRIAFRRDDISGKWNPIAPELMGNGFFPVGFSGDDDTVFSFYNKNGEPSALISESLKTGERKTLVQDTRGDLQIQWTEKPRTPFATISSIGIPKTHYLDEKSANAQLHKLFSKQFPGNTVNFINFSDDGNKLLFGVASDRDPGSFYLYDKKTNSADLLFSTSTAIDPEQMAERRPFQFKARDGYEIYGYLTMPNNADTSKQKLPMVVLPHGGPQSADEWYFENDAQFLASRGYAVLQVNFRGSGERGDNFRDAGYREWGGKIQDDLIDGVKAAISQAGIDAKRICTFGASFGGYSALMLTVREPDMFKCAVGYAGVYDLAYIFDETKSKSNKRFQSHYKRALGQDEAELVRFSPSKQADKIKVPVWLIHGGKDETSPVEHAKRMREALIKAGNPPEWTLEEDEGHGFYDAQRRKELYEKLEIFLAKHIGK